MVSGLDFLWPLLQNGLTVILERFVKVCFEVLLTELFVHIRLPISGKGGRKDFQERQGTQRPCLGDKCSPNLFIHWITTIQQILMEPPDIKI